MLKLDAFYNLQRRFDEVKRLHNADLEKLKMVNRHHMDEKDQKNKLQADIDKMNDVVCSSNDANNQQLKNIQFLEKKLDDFSAKNKELENRIKILTTKDTENTQKINNLTITQNENMKIINEYENLLKDFNLQLIHNEKLIHLVREMQNNLDIKNAKIAEHDAETRKLFGHLGYVEDGKARFDSKFNDRIERKFLDDCEREINLLKKKVTDLDAKTPKLLVTTSGTTIIKNGIKN